MRRTISEIHKQFGGAPAGSPTHVYDHEHRKIFIAEKHRHLQAVRDEIAWSGLVRDRHADSPAHGRKIYVVKRD
jgi:hypothetical protein